MATYGQCENKELKKKTSNMRVNSALCSNIRPNISSRVVLNDLKHREDPFTNILRKVSS